MKADFFQEPELEFGAGTHVDIRFGITNYGPLDVTNDLAPKTIQLGIVGTPDTVEIVTEWLLRCRNEIPAKKSRQPNLFPRFPGFHSEVGFRSELSLDTSLNRTIPSKVFDDLKRGVSSNDFIQKAVESCVTEFEYLSKSTAADVLICAVPPQIAELMDPASRSGGTDPALNFHDLLKARVMHLKPIQLILASTGDPKRARKLKIRRNEARAMQDDATRAWNFHTALYYKAHGRPWRLRRDLSQLTSCYVGISFYYTLERKSVLTSMAQLFDELGEGVVVRGGPVKVSKKDRTPRLDAESASVLLKEALSRYRATHQNFPARVVLHKTSSFSPEELDGFRSAAAEHSISTVDYLSLDEDSGQRLFRYGAYPPLRGTFLSLDSTRHLLYTRGSVDFYATYPGMYVPQPLLIRCDSIDQTPKFIAREMLALTKMNWNQTQFDGGIPITLVAARKVGEVLKYLGPDDPVADRYAHYM
jgi:hypothetical protein